MTGVGTRSSFARQVNQAAMDQELCAVALLALPTLDRLVSIAGAEACDGLVRDVARALTLASSASTTLARTAEGEFGVLVADFRDDNLDRWTSPLITSCRSAITKWRQDHAHLVVGTLPLPDLKVGVAKGADERIWEKAQRARQVAIDQMAAYAIVEYRRDDERIATVEATEAHELATISGLADNSLIAVRQTIASIRQPVQLRSWHRLTAAVRQDQPIDRDLLAPRLARSVELWLLSVVPETIDDAKECFVTVPIDAEISYGRTIASDIFPMLERMRISPGRFVFEIDQKTLTADVDRALSTLQQLDKIGAQTAVRDFDGGWTAWEAVLNSPIKLVTPTVSLMERLAVADRTAMRSVAAIATTCDEKHIGLNAPHTATEVPLETLSTIGFSTVSQRPEVVKRTSIEHTKFGRLSQG